MNQISSRPAVADYSAARPALRSGTLIEGPVLPGDESGLELEYPARVVSLTRLGHIPFLLWIVDALRPRMIVELGVDTGNSYCAFLQAVSQLGYDARCFGVDPWLGSAGEESHRALCSYHDPLYGAFSMLLRSPYDAAALNFADATIDLLHIDGARSHDAIDHDFKTWLSKMSPRGIVMFHDTNMRAGEPGALRVWENAQQRYPSFEFMHGNGLGIAYVGTEPAPATLKTLFDRTSKADPSHVRAYFSRLGISVYEHFVLREAEARIAETLESANLRTKVLEAELARTAEAKRGLEEALGRVPSTIDNKNLQSFRQQMALVARLQREVFTLNRYKLEWEQIRQSTSWRVTGPLRWLVIRFRWLIAQLTWPSKDSTR